MTTSADIVIVCGISTGFPVLFPTPGQITHVLLTRAPLYSGSCPPFLARLACVRHAASVDSEPGSNSQDKLDTFDLVTLKRPISALGLPNAELTRISKLYVFYFQRTSFTAPPFRACVAHDWLSGL